MGALPVTESLLKTLSVIASKSPKKTHSFRQDRSLYTYAQTYDPNGMLPIVYVSRFNLNQLSHRNLDTLMLLAKGQKIQTSSKHLSVALTHSLVHGQEELWGAK